MKRVFTALVSVVALGGAGNVDWKWFGYTDVEKRNVHLFYDEKGIKWLPDRIAQVWTKTLDAKEVGDTKPFPALLDQAGNRMRHQYKPPIGTIQTLTKEGYLNVLIWEGVANSGIAKPVSQALLEINCKAGTSRIISTTYEDPVRGFQSQEKASEWMHSPPESPGAGVIKMICG